MQKDNSTFEQKRKLRLTAMREVSAPVVMETNAGVGKLFASCYANVPAGVCFELQRDKAEVLASQRPTWSVYCCDTVLGLRHGVGSHLEVNFLDVDPYGEPWPILDAFFGSNRPRPQKLVVAVQDGLRLNLVMQTGWKINSMLEMVAKYGNGYIYNNYKDIAKELLQQKAALCGYKMTRWVAYYCGKSNAMTHYAAVLERSMLKKETTNA